MKKLLFIALLILSQNKLYSQVNYFNIIYNPLNTISKGYNIYSSQNGYDISCFVIDSVWYKYNFLLIKLDTIGNQKLIKEYKLDSCDFFIGGMGGGGFTKLNNGSFAIAGTIEPKPYRLFLWKLNSNFDTIWAKTLYSDTIPAAINHCIETTDKGFALCGHKYFFDGLERKNILFIKTDSSGNIMFQKIYNINNGHNGDRWESSLNIIETFDKGYILGCYTYDNSYQGSGDPVLIKTDSLGNFEWIKNLGGNEKDHGPQITNCADSNIMVSSIYSHYTDPNNLGFRGKMRLTKLNIFGYIIWDKLFNFDYYNFCVTKINQDNKGNFLISGTKYHEMLNSQSYYDSYLFKVNSNGDSIWFRDIKNTKPNTSEYVVNNLFDFNFTEENGIIGCGEVFKSMQIPQSMWVFKTDSLGCLQPGCQYVGVEELQKIKVGELKINPNPATTQTTINYPTAEKALTLQFYNMLGQLVYEEKLSKGSSQTTIDTRAYKKGLYKVVVGESSGSLIIN